MDEEINKHTKMRRYVRMWRSNEREKSFREKVDERENRLSVMGSLELIDG